MVESPLIMQSRQSLGLELWSRLRLFSCVPQSGGDDRTLELCGNCGPYVGPSGRKDPFTPLDYSYVEKSRRSIRSDD